MFRLFVAFLLGFAVKTLLCGFAGTSVFVENEVSPRRSRESGFRDSNRPCDISMRENLTSLSAAQPPAKPSSIKVVNHIAVAQTPQLSHTTPARVQSPRLNGTTPASHPHPKRRGAEKAIIVKETHHDELSLSRAHRLVKYSKGPALHGQQVVNIFHMLLDHTHNFLSHCKTDYVVHRGTLMGAWRHHGIIPWDIDVDVMINFKSLPPLLGCLAKYKEHEQVHWIARHGLHSDIIPLKIVDRKSGYYLDVYGCHEQGKLCLDRFGKPPGDPYVLSDLFPSRRCVFDHLVVNCPQKPKSVLTIAYRGDLAVPHKFIPQATKKLFSDVLWANNQTTVF